MESAEPIAQCGHRTRSTKDYCPSCYWRVKIRKMSVEKAFPAYFKKFELPVWARPQKLSVYRACATGKVEKDSFINTYEENGFCVLPGADESDPSQYSLSTYMKYKDVKRFMKLTSKYCVPFVIAEGRTNPAYGICLETKEWKQHLGEKTKSSHVDYWLYENATPWLDFHIYINEEA